MASRNPGRLAIHRRSDEIAFLQNRLRALGDVHTSRPDHQQPRVRLKDYRIDGDSSGVERALEREVLLRERDLVDELLHTRQIEPLGETLQRRLAMAERICHDLLARAGARYGTSDQDQRVPWDRLSDIYWVAEIERRALNDTLDQWWAWLNES